jgi:hypothetical protein
MLVSNLRSKLLAGMACALTLTVLSQGPALAGGDHTHAHMSDQKMSGVVVSEAMSPAAAPGIGTMAVYLLLENASGANVDLVGVESPAFAMTHLHKTAMADGLMTMEPVAQLTVPKGESVRFAPGGLHIMLMGAEQTYQPGDSFPLTLVFGSGQALEVEVSVVNPGEMPVGAHDHSTMKMN